MHSTLNISNSSLDFHSAVNTATKAILLVNAQHYHAWNLRRHLVADQVSGILVDDELRFTALILTKHSKSAPGWAYRRWLLAQQRADSVHRRLATANAELQLTARLCNYYAKNYYAWTHRHWVLQDALRRIGAAWDDRRLAVDQLIEPEFLRVKAWQAANVGDHCGHHYQLQVLQQWLQCLTPTIAQNLHRTMLTISHQRTVGDALPSSSGGDAGAEATAAPSQNTAPEADELPRLESLVPRLCDVADVGVKTAQALPGHEALGTYLQSLATFLFAVATHVPSSSAMKAVLTTAALRCEPAKS